MKDSDAALLLLMAAFGMGGTSGAVKHLPYEPVPMTDLPVASAFESKVLEPFALRSAPTPTPTGIGRVEWQDGNLLYINDSGWSYLATRTEKQQRVEMIFMWKALEGDRFICEGWNAYPGGIGHSALIYFKDKKVWHVHYGEQQDTFLMDLDPMLDWITVDMVANYVVPEIEAVSINGHLFEHLPIGNEPIGTGDFWQFNLHQLQYGKVLIRSMDAF